MPDARLPYTVYLLGEGFATKADGTPLYSWPFTVHYAPDYKSDPFCLGEGDGRNGSGSFFPAAVILEPQWREHLNRTNTLWLIPFLERIARGEAIAPQEVLHAYEQVHGKPPPTEQWQLFA